MNHIEHDIAGALAGVKARIAAAAKPRDFISAAAKPRAAVTLVAVSKNHDAAKAAAAIAAGQRHFGENRVQEAMAKWPALRALTPDLHLHLIGPLQTNKAADAVATFDVIHTIDRSRLAAKIGEEMKRQQRRLDCFVQVNTGREAQKAGVDPKDADSFIAACKSEWDIPVVGLMCIPPVDEEPALHFAFLREIARRNGLAQLSMGMSDDFEIAVALGATHVRVGSAIFGRRA